MKWYIIFATILIVFGCSDKQIHNQNLNNGGIIYSFDDQHIDDWYKFRNKFREYNIKATFFISRPQNLTDDQVNKLKQLVEEGHEIGCHGLNHRNALEFKDSVNYYYLSEVKPAVEILEQLGFDLKSFAYPYGSSTEQIDSSLRIHIPYIRKATWNIQDTTIDFYNEIYVNANSNQIVNSMGLDNNFRITLQNLEAGIKRAQRKNEILVVYNHRIDTVQNSYTVHPEFLEKAFQMSNKYELKSLRMCDLGKSF